MVVDAAQGMECDASSRLVGSGVKGSETTSGEVAQPGHLSYSQSHHDVRGQDRPAFSLRRRVTSLEVALAALGLEDTAAKVEVEPALRRANQESLVARLDPDTKALAAMEDFEGPEVVSLRTAQNRGQEDAQEVPVEVQIRDRDPFIKRARKRIAQIDEDRASEVRSLEEAERKLNDLKAFRTVQVDPASTPLPELER